MSSVKSRSSTKEAMSSLAERGKSASESVGSKSRKPASAGSSVNVKRPIKRGIKSSADQLRAKEEEYMRINAELEAKTSELVKEAEELLKGDLSALVTDPSTPPHPHNDAHSPLHTSYSPHLLLSNLLDNDILLAEPSPPKTQPLQRPNSSGAQDHTQSVAITKRPHSSAQGHPDPHSKSANSHSKPPSSAMGRPRSKTTKAKPMSKVDSIQLLIESDMDKGSIDEDDILPQVAEDMGPEATLRFLKAKLRVMQEEMDRLCQENREKDKALHQAETKLKETSEAASKAQRGHQSLVAQVDKYRVLSETLGHKCEGLEAQLVALRKEVDSVKGSQRKAASQQSSVEVRLNRALEECERYKTALGKARADLRDSSKQDRAKLDQLSAQNKQLERQKTELIAGFKKQMKLIDILKRQKMHIEAAKMLSFTEEEFVKALDWGNS